MDRGEVLSGELVHLVQQVVREELGLSTPVSEETRLIEDLQLDSVGLTILAVEIENRYRIKLSEADATALRTVADLCALVQRRVREAA